MLQRDALDNYEFEERRGDDLVVKEAIGVSGLITPWNFPTNQTSLKLAAAFAAGSPVVLKPSEETPFAAVILAEILIKSVFLKVYLTLLMVMVLVLGILYLNILKYA